MLFITRTGKMSGAVDAIPTSPIQICDCGASGLSTIVITRTAFLGRVGAGILGNGPSFQPPNRFSKSGSRVAASVSPTTNRAAFEGRNHALCQAATSLREMDLTDLTVPSPGYPQGCCSPKITRESTCWPTEEGSSRACAI